MQTEAVASAALDEILQRALVEVRAVHPRTEILKVGKQAVFRPLLNDPLDEAASDVLDGGKAGADALFRDGKMVIGFKRIVRRGINSVKLEIFLVSIGHNLYKYQNKKIRLQKTA